MDAMHLFPRATKRFPAVTAFTRSLGSSIVSLKDIGAESHKPVGLKKKKTFVISCISSSSSPDRRKIRRGHQTPGEEEANKSQNKTNSANQEEIISLFQRLQSSISNETRHSNVQQQKPAAKLSVLEIIRNSKRRQTKGKDSTIKREVQVMALTNFKLTRPRSNFIRRSPILLPTAARGKKLYLELLDDTNANEEVMSENNVSQLKLGELKEVAKSRGIKGYSKLKKRELLDLLKS